MGKPTYRTAPKVSQESRMDAFLITAHGGKELTVIVTSDISEALRQARQEEVVREAIQRDGGIWIMPLRS
jgi:hypothetical protein